MATLTALTFATPEAAQDALTHLTSLRERELLDPVEAALVSWPHGARRPMTRQLSELAGSQAFDGVFWGLLFGGIFFIPLLGVAAGGLHEGLAALEAAGIDSYFVRQTQRSVAVDSSALFFLASEAVRNRVIGEVRGHQFYFEVITTELSDDKEAELRALFAAS